MKATECWMALLFCLLVLPGAALAADRPNILIIWGDDIGYWNISRYSHGQMGYQTPNIDRIAREGMLFTDAYGEQSCTAGRAAFITGQHPYRTGLTRVGMPGASQGLQAEDPTIAEFLKPLGYVTGQFGKNHLGDRDEHLPTAHGFDEFFGNLYHLNAEEEPENVDYPEDPAFRERFGPRGVIRSSSDGRIEDTGPLTRKRMETVDEEFLDTALNFIDRAHAADKPFFVWFNATRMHVWTHLKESSRNVTGIGLYPDGMVEHDGHVGRLLAKLDELDIADNTIVMYSTDNGAETFSWPDGGTTPYRGEKNTNWEGGFRVPLIVKWPGVIKPGSVSNEIISHQDWLPTLVEAAGGESDVKAKLLKGHRAGDKRFRVHLDGYNFVPYFRGDVANGPRNEFYYFSDDGDIMGIRNGRFKIVFREQQAHGMEVWQQPFFALRMPKIFDLRADPFERADHEAMGYEQWLGERMFLFVPAQAQFAQWAATFRDFPQRQRPAAFNVDQVFEELRGAAQGD